MNDYRLDGSLKGKFREADGIADDSVIVAYVGKVGLKQGLETLVALNKSSIPEIAGTALF